MTSEEDVKAEHIKTISDFMSDKGKISGKLSAISGSMDRAGIPKASSVSARVKMLTIMYEQILAENKMLKFLVDEKK